MKKIYFFLIVAVLLFVFNLTKIDFQNLFSEDSKIGLAGVLACVCTILLLIILSISKKIKSKKD
ncbi:hypothetical protein N9326_02125 [Flavobacteriaceae bacterium]|jgi:hypothetical protein|nr:hypothetical protein [Flavobacteriales bacterium]MDA8937531.1 hypothetical protein [Flavobacteriaceae bacterium]MDA9338528.1 hypothetical protein [Flavobacteriaceae bacterium]MDB3901287.1 hypothetical protein [Flavobacteriaceae bacterium]MDB4113412.1 hypothetical protein [Flavobacteriaceae bacterium]